MFAPIDKCPLNEYCVFDTHAKRSVCRVANSFHFGNKYQEVFCCPKCDECFRMDFDDFVKIHGKHLSFLLRAKKRQMLKKFKSTHQHPVDPNVVQFSNSVSSPIECCITKPIPTIQTQQIQSLKHFSSSTKYFITVASIQSPPSVFPSVTPVDPQSQTMSRPITVDNCCQTEDTVQRSRGCQMEGTTSGTSESRLELLESHFSIILNQNKRLIEMLAQSNKDRSNEFQHLNYCHQRDFQKLNKFVAELSQSHQRMEDNYKRAITTLTFREASKVPDLVIKPPVIKPQKRPYKTSQVEVKSGAKLLPPLDSESPKRMKLQEKPQQQQQQVPQEEQQQQVQQEHQPQQQQQQVPQEEQQQQQVQQEHQPTDNIDKAWLMSDLFGDSE